MASSDLIGTWEIDPADHNAIHKLGRTIVEFKEDGSLTYQIITNDGKRQVMFLTYVVDGNTIVTNQPSHPREDRTLFELLSSDELRLTNRGVSVLYRRLDRNSKQKAESWWRLKRS
ncbi:MAG: hypothetical protein ACYC7A_22550 [Thermoanaerobaculia bacterium]